MELIIEAARHRIVTAPSIPAQLDNGPGQPGKEVAFRILGPLETAGSSGLAQIGGIKQRLVIAHLLLNANRTVSFDSFALSVWDATPRSIRSNLRTYVCLLRRSFLAAGIPPARLMTEVGGYRLDVQPGELDLSRSETLIVAARLALDKGEPGAAADHLERALGLWRGEPLAGLRVGPYLDAEVMRLQERHMLIRQWWADAALAARRFDEVAAEMAGLVRADPLREGLWARLIMALYRSGRQGEARRAYDQLRGLLDRELSVSPGSQIRELHDMIVNADPRLDLPITVPSLAARCV